jgi:TonB family protein
MFDQTFVDTHAHTRKPWTVAVSLGAQSLLVGIAVIIPMLHPEILHPKMDVPIFVHLQAMKHVAQVETTHSSAPSHPTVPRVFVAPTVIPTGVKSVKEIDMAPAGDSFAMVGTASQSDQSAGIFSKLIGVIPEVPPPQPKPAAVAKFELPAGPVRVSEGVQSAKLIYGPKPAYPSLARAARVEGRVRIQAIIASDGSIGSLQVISGPALLILAAKDAVSRWRYQPTLLSGKAVEVLTEIDVNFTLSQ